jgi:hypothetical protein
VLADEDAALVLARQAVGPGEGEPARRVPLSGFKESAEAYLRMHTKRLREIGAMNGKVFLVNEALSLIDRAPL